MLLKNRTFLALLNNAMRDLELLQDMAKLSLQRIIYLHL